MTHAYVCVSVFQTYRFYQDRGVDLSNAVLVDLGCGTGLGVLYAYFWGVRKIRASDIQGGLLKKMVDHYGEMYNADSDPYQALKEYLPGVEDFKRLFVLRDVNILNARYVERLLGCGVIAGVWLV